MAAYPNKYAGVCVTCNQQVPEQKGFITRVNGRWATWCNLHCPERIPVVCTPVQAKTVTKERKLTADGSVIMPFEPSNLPIIRSFPGAAWDKLAQCWRVSLNQADRLRVLEIADTLKLDVAAEFRNVEQTQQAVAAEVAGLYDYQVVGVNWLAKQDQALLGDEMGLGKTIETLVALPKNARVLVVAPAGLKYNWRDEANKWRPDFVATVINGSENVRSPKANEILIINYDIVPDFLAEPERKKREDWASFNRRVENFRMEIRQAHPDLCETILVVDEAHKVKGLDTQRGTKIRTLANICKKVWGLTGTPLLNRPMDLWGVLTNLNLTRRAFGDAKGEWAFPNFKRAFNCTESTSRFKKMDWGMPTAEVPERMRRVMLQRKRAEVLPDLPTKTYTDVIVSLNDLTGGSSIKKELDSLWDEWSGLLNVAEKLPDFTEFSAIRAKLAKACIPAMKEYIRNCEEQDVRLIVASAHLSPLDELLGMEGWAVISGATKPEDRQRIAAAQRNGSLNVGCSITAAGVGLTLTGASRMLFVDLDWVPANNWQMEDRICRIGQTANKCEIVRLVVDHPLVRHIHKLLAKKIALIGAAIDGKAQVKVTPGNTTTASTNVESESDFAARMELARKAEEELLAKQAKEEEANKIQRAKSKSLIVREREQERSKDSDRKLLPLTTERIAAVRRAFKFMLSVCDGAAKRDAQGFNKPDAVVAHVILPCGLETQDELEAAYWMLTRYSRQLGQQEPILFKE